MSETYSASGIDQVEQLVSELYLTVSLESGQLDPGLTITQTAVGSIVVGRSFYDMTVDIHAEPLGAIGIVHSRSGLANYRSRGEERTWRPSELYMSSKPADAFTAAFDHLDCDFAMYNATLLEEVAHPVRGDAGPVQLTGYTPISDHAAERWMATFEFVRNAAAQPEISPLVVGGISRLLAATTLATFPSNAALDPTIEDRHDAHPPTVRRAIDFIETHPDRDLTVVDIARAAFVTPRALQLAFRRHLNTTPTAYLRRVRLDCAHRDLLTGTPYNTTVTAIAMRWGFADPSRFACQYRDAYGNPPSETLHR